MTNDIWDGIVIGGAGGAIAGFTVYVIQFAHHKIIGRRDTERIRAWLTKDSPIDEGRKYRSTPAITSYNNLTEDRERYLCSHCKKTHLSTGEKEDLWSIHTRKHEMLTSYNKSPNRTPERFAGTLGSVGGAG